MTTVYVDGSVLAEPDAGTQLGHLQDAGQTVVLVGDRWPAGDETDAAHFDRLLAVPDSPAGGSWFMTADAEQCEERRSGFRTLLIGPRPEGPRPTVRCDYTARDVAAAVLEILATEAMA
jgi:hypothetical protein